MISLEKLSKKYGKSYAIKDITASFDGYSVTSIIGASGSGKSTLLRCINGLEEPTGGQVYVNGTKLTAKNKRKLRLKIGMVFQNFNLFPHMDVEQNLTYSPVNVLGMKLGEAKAKAVELLDKFGLKEKLHNKPANLSGGQKQRVAICRALMMNPEVMLFDEPTSALDPEVIKEVIEAISLLKTQMTMIVVTHHIKFAKAISDRIIFMDKGLVLCDQNIDDFFEKPKSHRARLFLENVGDLM
jgi:polar amino acid transport system ATP-binding protein